MQNISNFSGNLKLRIPKSLHLALTEQAEKEGISLNQLCLMYLSSSLSEHYLGAEQFNRRLEKIEALSGSSEDVLFQELRKLNEDVESLEPLLLKAIKDIYEKNPRSIGDQMEALSYIYPIYNGKAKFPYIKIPSVKIVLRPHDNEFLDYKEVERIVNPIPDTSVAYGDYDYYIPLENREINRNRGMSVVINVYCKFKSLLRLVTEIRNKLKDAGYENKAQLLIRPCFLHIDSKFLLEKAYKGEKFLDE